MAILASNVKFYLVFLCLLVVWAAVGSPDTGIEALDVPIIGAVFYGIAYVIGWSPALRLRTVTGMLVLALLVTFMLSPLERSETVAAKFVWFSYFGVGYYFANLIVMAFKRLQQNRRAQL